MSQKPNNRKASQKKSGVWNSAMTFFLFGCLAELFVLLVRKYYIYGNIDQVLAWDTYLIGVLWAGAAVFAAGVLMVAIVGRKPGWKRIAGWILVGVGLFLAATGWLSRTYYSTAVTLLCALVPAVMLLGILWSLYDRVCAWALTILGCDVVALWMCRKGLHTELWHNRVLAVVIAAFVLLVLAALVFYQADRKDGMLGKLRLLPAGSDPMTVYIACGVSALSLVLALVSAAAAYYAIWGVAVVIFAIAAYYTVKLL